MANCEVCKSTVTEFQPRVSLGARRTHLACFKTEHEREVRDRIKFEADVLAASVKEQADAKALRERMTREAEAKVKTEIEEAVRAKAHTEKAKADAEKLGIRPCKDAGKDAGKVPAMDRFSLLEIE